MECHILSTIVRSILFLLYFAENPYVVDINPRVNGSTALQLSMLFVHKTKGFTVGSYRKGIYLILALDDLIQKLENISTGMAVLVYALPKEEGLECGIRVYADNLESCNEIFMLINANFEA